MQRVLVLGAGFAGLWSAVGAARTLDELGIGPERVEVLVINRTGWHSIRVRNYEAVLNETLVPLSDVLDPIGVKHVEGEVTDIDLPGRTVACSIQGKSHAFPYDRLVFALGSRLVRPPIPGLEEHAFDVDTYDGAARLNSHIAALPSRRPSPGLYTVLVVGGGLMGIEAATEMLGKLRAAWAGAGSDPACPFRVILADRQPWIGSDMGESAKPVIGEALRALGVETRVGVSVASVDEQGATLTTGERVATATVVWCAGMQANPLTARFPTVRDRLGRLPVDAFLKVEGRTTEFAAGDVAWLPIDGTHPSVMSCQHARPMGRFAGHNAVCDLLGRPVLPLHIDWYTTILDLGPWGRSTPRAGTVMSSHRVRPPSARKRSSIVSAFIRRTHAMLEKSSTPPRRRCRRRRSYSIRSHLH